MTASPTATDADAGMPGELFAENAQNSAPGAQVGLPSEEEIARVIDAALCQPDTVNYGAANILSLIRPAVEAKEREIAKRDEWVTHWQTKCQATNGLLQETKAKLAQAVEALEPFAEVADTEEGVGRDDPEDDRILVVQTHGCQLAILSTEDFRRARSAARGETR